MCSFGSSGKQARLQMMQQAQQAQQQLQASQTISPAPPMRADEERRRGVLASVAESRERQGFSSTILNGGAGVANYGMSGGNAVARAVLGG